MCTFVTMMRAKECNGGPNPEINAGSRNHVSCKFLKFEKYVGNAMKGLEDLESKLGCEGQQLQIRLCSTILWSGLD